MLANRRSPAMGCPARLCFSIPTGCRGPRRVAPCWCTSKCGFDLDRKVTDPHFFPIYEEASALDLPLCIHTGHPLPGSEWDLGFPIMYSCCAR